MNKEIFNAVIAICSAVITVLLIIKTTPRRLFRRRRYYDIGQLEEMEIRIDNRITEVQTDLETRIEKIEGKFQENSRKTKNQDP